MYSAYVLCRRSCGSVGVKRAVVVATMWRFRARLSPALVEETRPVVQKISDIFHPEASFLDYFAPRLSPWRIDHEARETESEMRDKVSAITFCRHE